MKKMCSIVEYSFVRRSHGQVSQTERDVLL